LPQSSNTYLRSVFCVLDIESTGGPFGQEAIMEIAIYRYDGEEVVDQLISLVHPHRKVQKFVSKMTGINDKMLLRAPRFHEIAKRILEISRDSVLVGHNVEFDYRMLRQEFARLGYEYTSETLDTIKLAEELIPDLPAYGLDKICEELNIYRSQKHRADDDARATLELFRILQEKDRKKGINTLGQSIQETNYYRDKASDLMRSIKNNKGLFYLHDRQGKVLYLGASDNIKTALNRIFLSQSKRSRDLVEKTHSVKTELAGNWLIARIKKAEELAQAHPPFNKNGEFSLSHGIFSDSRSHPPRVFASLLRDAGRKKPVAKAAGGKMAGRALRMFTRAFNEEERQEVLESVKNLPQTTVYTGKGRSTTERCALVVKDSRLAGYLYFSLDEQLKMNDALFKSMTPVPPKEVFTELLKLGILSGEFKPARAALE